MKSRIVKAVAAALIAGALLVAGAAPLGQPGLPIGSFTVQH